MFKQISELPRGIKGFQAIGEIRSEDYENVLEPVLDQAQQDGERVRLLFEFGPDFEGYSAGGAWEDLRLGLQHLRTFDACAVVTDREWVAKGTRAVGPLLPFPVREFTLGQEKDAVEWLEAPPDSPHIRYRLLSDIGLLVLEVDDKLRAGDFDAIAVTVDSWIEAGNELSGIVIRSTRFPGWEDFGALLRHLRFVRNHHKKVGRVAIVTDGKITHAIPRVLNPFVSAKAKAFEQHQLKKAIDWAAGGADSD